MSEKKRVLISGCLIGKNCRYDGKSKTLPTLERISQKFDLVAFCPEASVMSTPRPMAFFESGDGKEVWQSSARVVDEHGKDVTELFKKGAEKTLELAQKNHIDFAILKDGSPSCGTSTVYTGGSTKEHRQPGIGVTTALLQAHGIRVVSEEPS